MAFQPASGADKRTSVSGQSGSALLIINQLAPPRAEKTGHTCPVLPAIPVSGVERACPPRFHVTARGCEFRGAGDGVNPAKVILENGLGGLKNTLCWCHGGRRAADRAGVFRPEADRTDDFGQSGELQDRPGGLGVLRSREHPLCSIISITCARLKQAPEGSDSRPSAADHSWGATRTLVPSTRRY